MAEAIRQKLRDQLPALKALAGIGIEASRVTNAPDEAPKPTASESPNMNAVMDGKDADHSAQVPETEIGAPTSAEASSSAR